MQKITRRRTPSKKALEAEEAQITIEMIRSKRNQSKGAQLIAKMAEKGRKQAVDELNAGENHPQTSSHNDEPDIDDLRV